MTAHGFVCVGEEPCVILAAGNRRDDLVRVYPRSDLALRHGAGVERETDSSAEAYGEARGEWRVERPLGWDGLPWSPPG
jgi:uncharacterized cupin superfamily protein